MEACCSEPKQLDAEEQVLGSVNAALLAATTKQQQVVMQIVSLEVGMVAPQVQFAATQKETRLSRALLQKLVASAVISPGIEVVARDLNSDCYLSVCSYFVWETW